MINSIFKELTEKFPFLSYFVYNDQHLLGIIQNSDSSITSAYIYSDIKDKKLKREFLKLGDEWWWQSNRKIPINIFIKERFIPYKSILKSYSIKNIAILSGQTLSLTSSTTKHIKKRQIRLIRKL